MNCTLDLQWVSTGPRPPRRDQEGQTFAECDASGRFRLVWREFFWKLPGKFEVSVLEDALGSATHAGQLALDEEPQPGTDVGDVVVQPLPSLVAGIVVDPEGEPLEAVDLHADLENDRWIDSLHAATDEQGRFSMLGSPLVAEADARGHLVLTARRPLFRDVDSIEFKPGRSDLKIVLQHERALPLELQVDADVPLPSIQVSRRATPTDEWRWCARPDAEGAVSFDPGDAASLDLRFTAKTIERDPVELAVVTKVELTPDGTSPDPRLHPVDLRGRLVITKLELRDPDRKSIDQARARLVFEPANASGDGGLGPPEAPADAMARLENRSLEDLIRRGWPPALERLRDGELRIVSGRAGVPVEIDAPGFVPQRIEARGGESTVVLARGASIRLDFSNAWNNLGIWKTPFHLRAALAPQGSPLVRPASARAAPIPCSPSRNPAATA